MINRKHICFFPGALNLGGIGKLTINIASELIKKGVKVDFFLSNPVGEYLNQIPDEVNIFNGNGKVSNSFFEFLRYIRRENPDYIVSARDYINIANILACFISNSSTKAITSVHVDYSSMPKENGLRAFLIQQMGKLLYPHSHKIIAVSKGVAINHTERMNLNSSDVSVIYNPVFNQDVINNQIGSNTHEWIINKSTPVIIGVGRLTEQKNFRLLIKSFAKVKKALDARLIIIGEGEEREYLQELIVELGLKDYISLPGYVNNPSEYIRKSDLFVMSSSWEGFGNVIVEALGVGTKVVSTNCPSGPTEILEDGKYGRLVPVGNAEKMADAIIEALDSEMDSDFLINRAKEFSAEKIAEQYLEIIYK